MYIEIRNERIIAGIINTQMITLDAKNEICSRSISLIEKDFLEIRCITQKDQIRLSWLYKNFFARSFDEKLRLFFLGILRTISNFVSKKNVQFSLQLYINRRRNRSRLCQINKAGVQMPLQQHVVAILRALCGCSTLCPIDCQVGRVKVHGTTE